MTPVDVRPWDRIEEPDEAETRTYAAGIANALNMDADEVAAVLLRTVDETTGDPVTYALLKKDATHAETEALQAFREETRLGGIRVDTETRRYYPFNTFAAQLIGFTRQDQNTLTGVSGVEATYNSELSGQPGYTYSENEKHFRRTDAVFDPDEPAGTGRLHG